MPAHLIRDTPVQHPQSPPQIGSPILVIIPAWNEQASIGEVVQHVRGLDGFHVLVVDDASSDDTATLARRAGAQVVTLPVNLGAWGAM